MFKNLPNTMQLRAFEASARHLSFTKAATELFLTQSAVSHQINGLETLVKQKLFLRQNRSLTLTKHGQEFLGVVRKILPILHRSVEKMRSENTNNSISISTLPSIAATWLVTKLGRLRNRFPNINFKVIASDEPDFFSSDATIDFAIHFTHPTEKNLWQKKMMDEFYLPVCSPALMNNPDIPLTSPEDLQHQTLIHQDETLGWTGWFEHYALMDITPKNILSFNHGDLAIQAAMDGQGIAMARHIMAQRALEQNSLVPVFNMPLPTRRKYYILAPKENTENPAVMKIIDWLCDEAEKDEKYAEKHKASLPKT